MLDASNLMMSKLAFRDLSLIWKTYIDLFAAAWNAQHHKFVSWTLQLDAFAINAFLLHWKPSELSVSPVLLNSLLSGEDSERASRIGVNLPPMDQ